jgi:predicted TIM-barrel fold metal-dependent hydrolase
MVKHALTLEVPDLSGRFAVVRQIDEIGIDKVMWPSDYPHNESTFGYSERSLAAVVEALGPADAARVVSGNIKKFLGI